jgi:hypothetical protein
MSIPLNQLTTTCDIYRPFGAGAPTTTGVACRLVPDIARGRVTAAGMISWTHYLDLDEGVDIRDACSRLGGADAVNYFDGDEVRIPNASGSRYVVVWVEVINRGTARQYKRAYLVRDTAAWPGP